jgi:unsaturated rhamnogalacturonyl hydrolase
MSPLSHTHSAHAVLQATANRTLDFDFTIWQWGDAVAIDGLLEAGALLGDRKYTDRVASYYQKWSRRSFSWQDHLCPGLGLLRLFKETGDGALLEAAIRLASLLRAAPRSFKTGAPLYRPDLGFARSCVWVDTIYHEPSFLCELASVTGDKGYFEAALEVWFTHVSTLITGRGPFLHHAVETGMHAYKGYGWGRGQGWALYGMIDTLERLPQNHPRYIEGCDTALTLARHILGHQDPSGFWRTLIHDRESYLETSTAGFLGGAFYRGVRIGILGSEFNAAADKAWEAILSRVDLNTGDLTGVSAWTHPGTTLDDSVSMYKTLPTEVNWWGQGSAMRLAAERIHNGFQ